MRLRFAVVPWYTRFRALTLPWQDSASSSKRGSNGATIGAGVGAGVAVLLAAVVLVVYFRGKDERKRRAVENRLTVSFENPTVRHAGLSCVHNMVIAWLCF
jgi:hypothetical protein